MFIGLLIAILPGLVLLFLVIKQDRIEPEPIFLIIKLFVFGIIAVLFAIIFEFIFNQLVTSKMSISFVSLLVDNFFNIALIEEFVKWVVVYKLMYNDYHFDYRFDGIVYATAASLGFAILENIIYINYYGLTTGIIRDFTAIFGHCIFGIVMGYFLGWAKMNQKQNKNFKLLLFLSIVVPMIIHGTYDFLLSLGLVKEFLIYIVVLDIITLILVNVASFTDKSVYK